MKNRILIFSILIFLLSACGDKEEPQEMFTDSFDRREMLTDWADQIIIPAFESYSSNIEQLVKDKDLFLEEATVSTLQNLRSSYIAAYKSWQRLSIFDIGKAEEIGLRNFTNIFPTSVEEIEENIENQDYNLELPSTFDAQGFPALDYLLYGSASSDLMIVDLLSQNGYKIYLDDVITRLSSLTTEVLMDWNNGYRQSFIDNDGASATASVDKVVNDFLFHYERFFRAGKIGIPAGIFSGNPLPTAVEAPYSEVHSKDLFDEAFGAVQDFFAGKSFDGLNTGVSLKAYLDYLHAQEQTYDISSDLIAQWELADEKAENLSENLGNQVEENNLLMLETYDELQKAVVIMKVDMMQALNIQVDYVDADGD